MDLELNGTVAVVTGASKGIGYAVVRTLLDEGARVVAASRKPSAELDALAGPDLVHIPIDLMDPAAPAAVVERAVAEFGRLDVLVNNAGGPPPGATLPSFSFLAADDAGWRAMFEFNLFSAVRAVRAALPHLLERGGAVVNVASTMARQPSAINVDYGAAKAAVLHLTKALSEEYGPRGVRVNAVSPGPVRTPWWTDPGGAAEVFGAAVGSGAVDVLDRVAPEMMRLTTGRLSTPQEVADVIALLASPRSASTTGAEFVVDSGARKEI